MYRLKTLMTLLVCLLTACASQRQTHSGTQGEPRRDVAKSVGDLKLTSMSSDSAYGYSPSNPIKVGGNDNTGPRNERKYLERLRGPKGEKVTYERLASCCLYENKNHWTGYAMLDKYRVNYDGLRHALFLYLDEYRSEELKAPEGFTLVD